MDLKLPVLTRLDTFWPTDRSGYCHGYSVCLSSVTFVDCAQTAGPIEMPLGTAVGVG